MKKIQPSITDDHHKYLESEKSKNPSRNFGVVITEALDLLIAKEKRKAK